MPLTDTAIKALKPRDRQYKKSDEKGLYLLVRTTGGKLWQMKYRIHGREKTLSFGQYPDVSLKKARAKRDEAREMIADGIDPSSVKQAAKNAAGDTFSVLADEWAVKQQWAEGTRKNIESRIANDLKPWLGNMPINTITAPELLRVLRRVESRGAIEAAHRVRQYFGQIARYAIATGRADRDVSQDLKGALTPIKVTHRAAVTKPTDAGALMRVISDYKGSLVTRIALLFSAYTFARPGEIRHAEWSEFDGDIWRVPAEKMKMRRDHIVPLSTQVLQLLEEIKPITGKSNYVFPSERSLKRPMSENTVNGAIRRLGYSKEEMTAHGFRGMASTLLNELGYNRDWIERQLAHVEGNEIRASYNHAEHLPERKKMMQEWADYLDEIRNNPQ